MALFNITNDSSTNDFKEFKASNMNIRIDTTELKISELNITYQEWLGNF